MNQRFGILVHQVLERYHGGVRARGLPELLGLLEAGWRRGGFGDSEEERQFRAKATQALVRYHDRFREEDGEPVWFERAFQFRLGPHLLRGRVDRVDRLPDGGYELIDYKTGRPKTAAQLREDVQLSLYAVGRARVLAARGGPAGLLLRARRREGARRALRRRTATGSPRPSSGSPTASSGRASSRRRARRRARCATTGSPARPPSDRFRPPSSQARTLGRRYPSPRWRRKRWNSRARTSPDGRCPGRAARLLVGRALEALDERLDVGVELDRARDLALVVAGRVLELAARRRSRRPALSSRRSSASAPLGFGATAT